MQHKKKNNIIHKLQSTSQKWLNSHILYSMQVFCVALSVIFIGVLCIPESTYAATLAKPANNLGLVGYWSFNEGTGSVATDFSGNGTNMTLIDGSPTWVDGKNGKALGLLASNDVFYGNASGPINTLSNNFTISMWVKLSNTSQSNKYVFGKLNNAGTNNVFAILYGYSTNAFEFFCGTGCATGYPGTATRISITDTSWHNITYTYDGATFRGYLDGVAAITPITVSFSLTASTNQVVFGDFTIANCCNLLGSIDETRVYSRALSAAQVSSLYNTGAQKLKTGVSNNGLVGYWSFNDATSTTATDFSGNGNTGTLTNMSAPATATSGWGNGKLGGGLNFDGTNDYVDTGDNTALNFGTGDFTVSTWVYNTSQNTRDTIIGKDSNVGGRQFVLQLNSNTVGGVVAGEIIAGIFSASTPVYAGVTSSAGVLSPNAWHQIVFQRVSGTLYLFLDGVSLSVTTNGNAAASLNVLDTTGPMQIGARQYTGSQDYFAGKIDEVRIYNRALSTAEIASLYTSGAQKINASRNVTGSSLDSGLVGLWSFDGKDINGTTAFDRSGSGNNGTLTNSPTPSIGKMGQALTFNESNTYVNVPDSASLQVTSQFTLSAWIYFTGNQSNIDTIFMKNNSNANYYGIYLSGNRAFFYNPSITMATTPSYSTANKWTHIVVTFDSTLPSNNAKIYLNGAFDNAVTKTTAFGSNAGGTLTIGRDPVNGRYFGGKIDDVRIYNRALSADEVKLLYNFGK